MSILPSAPFVPARYFDNSGNILSGGLLYFYAAGTTTPKDTYQDYQGTTPNANPVVLDSSGHAVVFLGEGLYKVELRDSLGVVLAPAIDGIGGAVSSSTSIVVDVYDDLRAIDDTTAKSVSVLGRSVVGDGGGGLFLWDADETMADDGGAVLAPTTLPSSGRWVRVRDAQLRFSWWGVADGSTDETAALNLALQASAVLKAPLYIDGGSVRITANVTIPAGAELRTALGGKITSTTIAYTLTCAAGARFFGSYGCFGEKIGLNPGGPYPIGVEYIDPDWWVGAGMSDSAAIVWAGQYLGDETPIKIARRYNLATSYTQPDYAILAFEGEGRLIWDDTGTWTNTIKRWTGSDDVVRFRMDHPTAGTLTLSNDQGRYFTPTFFGGEGWICRALQHGWVYFDKVYDGSIETALISFGNNIHIKGFQSGTNEGFSLVNSTWIKSGWIVPELILSMGGDFLAENVVIYNASTDAALQAEFAIAGNATLRNCAISAYLKTTPTYSEGILIDSNQVMELDGCTSGYAAFECSTGTIRDSDISVGYYAFPTSAALKSSGGGIWAISDSYIDSVEAGCSLYIENSSVTEGGATFLGKCNGSTLGCTSYTVLGQVINSDLGSGPVIGSGYFEFINSDFVWNGQGYARIISPRTISGTNRINPGWLGAYEIDGILGPTQAKGREALGSSEIVTAATPNWAFGAIGVPTVVSNAFYWPGPYAFSGMTITKTIASNDEKLLAAYGGILSVEVTAGTDTTVTEMSLLFGAHSTMIDSPMFAGAARNWTCTFPIWPGADSTVTDYQITINGNGGNDINEITIKVTIVPCAPRTQAEWDLYWNWDDPLVITGSRWNIWRETVTGQPRLGLWCAEMPAQGGVAPYYLPRPETTQPWLPLLTTKTVYIWPMDTTYGTAGPSTVNDTGIAFTKQGAAVGFSVLTCGYIA